MCGYLNLPEENCVKLMCDNMSACLILPKDSTLVVIMCITSKMYLQTSSYKHETINRLQLNHN